jgi:hypothetical protein
MSHAAKLTEKVKTEFAMLTEHRQALVLAAYAHELTILARNGYEVGTEQLSDPQLVRRLNEVQHRVASAIVSRLQGSKERYPDDALIDIITGAGGDMFSVQLHLSFLRSWNHAFGTELGKNLPA